MYETGSYIEKYFLQNKSHHHSDLIETSLISIRQKITEIFQFKYIEEVIPR